MRPKIMPLALLGLAAGTVHPAGAWASADLAVTQALQGYEASRFQDGVDDVITIENTGPDIAQGVSLHLNWPGYFFSVNSGLPKDCHVWALGSIPGVDYIDCELGDLASGEQRVYTVRFQQGYQWAGAVLDVTATVQTSSDDLAPDNNASALNRADIRLLPPGLLDPASAVGETVDVQLKGALLGPEQPVRVGKPAKLVAKFQNRTHATQAGIVGVLYQFSKPVQFDLSRGPFYVCKPVEEVTGACLYDTDSPVFLSDFNQAGLSLAHGQQLRQKVTVAPQQPGRLKAKATVFSAAGQDSHPADNTVARSLKVVRAGQ